jgi:hypothetical protein
VRSVVEGVSYLGGGHVGGRLDPFHRVADLLDGIDERADVAGDIVEEVDGRHRLESECKTVAVPGSFLGASSEGQPHGASRRVAGVHKKSSRLRHPFAISKMHDHFIALNHQNNLPI